MCSTCTVKWAESAHMLLYNYPPAHIYKPPSNGIQFPRVTFKFHIMPLIINKAQKIKPSAFSMLRNINRHKR